MLTRTMHFDEIATPEGLVCAPDPHVAEAGASILRAGGNAVDAAVATAFAEGVANPWSSGIGGSATMTIAMRNPDRLAIVEGHMAAPSGVSNEAFPLAPARTGTGRLGVFDWPQVVDNVNLYGPKSVAIPGCVAALCEAQARYGRLPLDAVMQPAIRFAGDGVPINWYTASFIVADQVSLGRDPGCSEILLPGGRPLRPPSVRAADKIVQTRLADTLTLIAVKGPEVFYKGELASAIVRFLGDRGGLFDIDDLATYTVVSSERPLQKPYGRYTVVGSPVMGSPTVVQALYLYDQLVRSEDVPEGEGPHDDAVAWTKALRLAFRDRLRYMTADPDVTVPWEGLRSREYAREVLKAEAEGTAPPDPTNFSGENADPPAAPNPSTAGGLTSHMSVGDRDGNLVSVTATQLNSWGARLLDPDTGILFNNGMGYFDPSRSA
jgi:gamma-glutamyltranspeptidase/glutathione hydrolase